VTPFQSSAPLEMVEGLFSSHPAAPCLFQLVFGVYELWGVLFANVSHFPRPFVLFVAYKRGLYKGTMKEWRGGQSKCERAVATNSRKIHHSSTN